MKKVSKMNEEEMTEMIKEELEKEFLSLVAKGEDIRSFLYYPQHILTKKIRDHLDVFLMEEAWKALSSKDFDANCFTVYRDELITVTLPKKIQQVKLLERLISYFIIKEEYEKCFLLSEILKQLS